MNKKDLHVIVKNLIKFLFSKTMELAHVSYMFNTSQLLIKTI